jgi:hypothetical protein
MRLRSTALKAMLAVPLAAAGLACAQKAAPCKSSADASYVQLSKPVVTAWQQLKVGSPIYALDDASGSKDWLTKALVQRIDAQTGIWNILMEPGYSVFRIYPFLSKNDPTPCVYQGIVVKVNGSLSVEDLLAAIRSRTTTIRIDSYDVFGVEGIGVQRYSRQKTQSVSRP